MKKIIIMLQSVLVCVAMVFCGLSIAAPEVGVSAQTTNASESTSKVYSNDYYTLSYENNEIKVLLNTDVTVYKNLSKEDLVELKNAIVSVAYSAITDDMDFSSLISGLKSKIRTGADVSKKYLDEESLSGEVDTSLIGGIISGQLTDLDVINDAIYGEKFDVLVEYYVDRYVDAYVADNKEATVEETLVKVQEQLTATIQEAVEKVYEEEGLSNYAPIADTQAKIESIVTTVKENKENNQSISINLSEVKEIIELVNDKDVIVDVINEIKVTDEIKDIVVASTPEETVDFLTTVDMDTIINVYKNINIAKDEVKDIISNVGVDNLVDVIDKVGIDNIKDLAGEMGFTSEDLKEVISSSASDISISSLIKSIKRISVDNEAIFKDGQLCMAGFKSIIKNLPKLSEIANLSDEEMQFTWFLECETIFGTVGFDFTIGFKGDCSKIRNVCSILADVIDVAIVDGVVCIDINAPEKLANIYLRLCNTGIISDDIKHALFNNAFGTVDELYNNIMDKEFEEYLNYLKQVDYKVILANLYNAENLNAIFRTELVTDERLDRFVNAVCRLVSKAANKTEGLTYDKVQEFVCQFVDISRLDNTAVEKLVNKALDVLQKIDAKELDAQLLREFIDPNSQYTNENIYKYIDKLGNYEKYFDLLMSYVEKGYDKMPDRFKDNSVLDFYLGDGEFNYTGSFTLNFEKVLTSISSKYGQKIFDAMEVVFDSLPSQLDVNITVNFENINKVTYYIGNEVVEGMLPVGANLHYFANANDVDGYKIVKWVDEAGNEYIEMPDQDIVLYAVVEFEASILEGVEKVYDGEEFVLETSVVPGANYSYQWYKDGELIEGATESTLAVVNVKDSGSYYCVVSTPVYSVATEAVVVNITKAQIEVSDLAWDYEEAFDYDGEEKEVKLVSVPEGLEAVYEGNKATNAGEYTAKVVFELVDDVNFEVVGEVSDLAWAINKAKIEVSDLAWDYEEAFDYDGEEKEVKLVSVPEGLEAVYEGNKATNAGEYTAKVVFELVDDVNFEVVGEVSDLAWAINKAKIEVSDLAWDYEEAFDYDGEEKEVKLVSVPEGLKATYTGNCNTNAGEYTAKVTFELVDAVNFEVVGEVSDLAWEINKAKIDVSELEWNYTNAFTYDGNAKKVELVSVPEGLKTTYTDNEKTNAGAYTAKVAFEALDAVNFEVVGEVSDLAWAINKAKVDVSGLTWNYTQAFTYDGNVKKVELASVPAGLKVTYTNNEKTNAGDYKAEATVALEDANNYEITGEVSDLAWAINKANLDASALTWNYTQAFTYSGNAYTVELQGTVAGITVTYTGNTATNAGTYTATATLSYDSNNYNVTGAPADLEWVINKAKIDVSNVQWDYTGPFTYDGSAKTVVLAANTVPAGVSVAYANNTYTNVGTYTATATLSLNDAANNELVGYPVTTLDWEIKDDTTIEPTFSFEVKDESGNVVLSITSQNGINPDYQATINDYVFAELEIDFSSILEEGKRAKIVAAYDIFFLDKEGNTATVSDTFTVRLLIPVELRDIEDLRIAHLASDNTPEDMKATREGDYLVFTTTHFSVYSILKVSDCPSYAWLLWIVIILLVVVIVLAVLLVLQYKKNNPKAENVEEAKVEEVEEEVQEEVVVEAPVVKVKKIKRRLLNKLMVAPLQTKENYNEMKNYLLSYGASVKMTNSFEIFKCEEIVAKLGIGGKQIKVFLAMDPKDLEGTKYKFKDYSDKKRYLAIPVLVKVRSARSLKYFKELVDQMMKSLNVAKLESYENHDYVTDLIPNGESILGNMNLPAAVMVDSITIKDISEELPDNLIDSIYTVNYEALEEEAVEANVYLDTLCKHFENGDVITFDVLKAKNVVREGNVIRVKARGTLDKKFTIYAEEFDEKALKMLLSANCTPVRVVRPIKENVVVETPEVNEVPENKE